MCRKLICLFYLFLLLILSGNASGQGNGPVKFKGAIEADEQYSQSVCDGSYYVTVVIEEVIEDPENLLEAITSVDVCYEQPLNLSAGESVEVYGYYYGGISAPQYSGRVVAFGDSYYIVHQDAWVTFIAHFMTPEGKPYLFKNFIISDGELRQESMDVTYLETEVPAHRLTCTMTYQIDNTMFMHQLFLEPSPGKVTEVEFYAHDHNSLPPFTPVVFAKEVGATTSVSSNYDPVTGVLNITADIQPPGKFGRLKYYLDKSSAELPQYFLEEYTGEDGFTYNVDNYYGSGSEGIETCALFDTETSSGETSDFTASFDIIIWKHKHTWTWSSAVGVSGVTYNGSIIRPFDLSLEKVGGQRKGIEFLWPQFHVPSGEEGYYILHIEDLPGEYIELDLPIYVSPNSFCLPQTYHPKASELESYSFRVVAEEFVNTASFSNLFHDKVNQTLSVDFRTDNRHQSWGCFVLPKDYPLKTAYAIEAGQSIELKEASHYTVSDIDTDDDGAYDQSLVVVRCTSSTEQIIVDYIGNILANGSFEDDEVILDDPDWYQWATWNPPEGAGSNATIVDTDSVDGTRSLLIEPVGPANWHFIVLYTPIPVEVSESYTASFWAKAAEPRPFAAQFKATDNTDSWGYTDFQLTTEWAEYSFTADALNAEAKLEFMCAGVEVSLSLDSVSVYKVADAPAVPTVTNLALNPSFEEDEVVLDDPDWYSWATWNPPEGAGSNATIVDTDSVDGTRSLRIEPVGPADWHFIVLNLPIMVDMSKNYTVSFWAKAEAPRPLAVQMKATDNSINAWNTTTFELTTEWAEYSYTSEVLIDNIKLEILCAGSEVPFWLDSVSVYEAQ